MTGRKQATFAWVTAVCLILSASTALAQDPGDVRVGITYTPGYLPGLVMTPVEAEGPLGTAVAQVDSILRRDLDYADRFQIIPVPDDLPTDGPVNYGLWNQLGAVWLVVSELTGTASQPVLRVSLHDVVFSELKEVKAFSLPRPGDSGFRMAVHKVSDEIVTWATGEPGIAASRIVFRRMVTPTASDLFLIDSDGFGLRRLTHEAATNDSAIAMSAELSPNGRFVVYVSFKSGKPVIYELDLVTGAEQVISDIGKINVTPVYSPDGRRILFGRTQDDHTELFEIQRDPLCCTRRVTYTSTGETLGGAYSPDGRQLAITSTPLGNPQIYVLDLQRGGDPAIVSRYVFGERGYATSPHWSPRGDRIAYHTWVDSWFQIVTVNPDGTDRRVMTSRGSNEDPSWAPDGRHLVFAGTLRGYYALWVLDTVSGRLRSVTVNQVDQLPHWSASIPPGS
jgi:TolB protein